MVKHILVQQLAGVPDSYFWGVVNDSGQWREPPQTGDKMALLPSLQLMQLPIVLVIPGEKVVTTQVVYNPLEKRHFRQLLPYQLEEQIIGDVEDLHFVTGPLQAGSAIAAYVDDAWFAETIGWYESHGLIIDRCVPDFQLLTPAVNQWIIWSTGLRILCRQYNGLGFVIHVNALQPLLADIFHGSSRVNERGEQLAAHDDNKDSNVDVQLFAGSEEALDYLTECLPDSIRQQASRNIGEPVFNLLANNGINFCQGRYAKRLPLNAWWQASRASVFLAVAALLAFVSVNLLEIFQLKDRQQLVKQQIEQSYRAVVPQGAIADPVRQLQSRLGAADTYLNNSQAVYLISAVAPAIRAQDINIRTLVYNNNDNSLRLIVEAKAFSAIEKLRKQLQTNGLQAQLKRSDSRDDAVQAHLDIHMAEG